LNKYPICRKKWPWKQSRRNWELTGIFNSQSFELGKGKIHLYFLGSGGKISTGYHSIPKADIQEDVNIALK
jgi:hypothetical protein